MIVVQVTYTVKPEFVQANRENIRRFLADFAQLGSNDFRYSVFLKADGNTFVHLSQYEHADIQQRLLEIPSFKDFQRQRDASGLTGEPVIDFMEPVGSAPAVF